MDATNFCSSCCGESCSRLSFNFGGPWDGRERGGEGKDEWVGIWGVDADNFPCSCSADAAVLVYLSILDAPGMGGRGQRDREGWVGWELGSGCNGRNWIW